MSKRVSTNTRARNYPGVMLSGVFGAESPRVSVPCSDAVGTRFCTLLAKRRMDIMFSFRVYHTVCVGWPSR